VFRVFANSGGAATPEGDQLFSEAFGKVASSRPALMKLLLEEGPRTQYFQMRVALSAAVLGLDRRRREEKPLVL
jgi:hypothetical protein